MGRAGGGSERRDRQLQWTIGGSPIDYHNCVVRADLPAAAMGYSVYRCLGFEEHCRIRIYEWRP